MPRIFFYQRRNPSTGELIDDYIDTDEMGAHMYETNPRFFKYIGWSDGRFIQKVRIPAKKKRGTEVMLQVTKIDKQKILDAQKAELEFAKENQDKTRPRDMSKRTIDGKPLTDKRVLGALGMME